MASIYIFNKAVNKFSPNLFTKAITNEGKIIAGLSKFTFENYLLKMEFGLYSFIFGSSSYLLLVGTNPGDLLELKVPSILGTIANCGLYISTPVIAGFRTYRAIRSGNINVMQLQ